MQEYIEPEDVFDVNPKAETSGLAGNDGNAMDPEIDILTEDPVATPLSLPLHDMPFHAAFVGTIFQS